MIVNLKGTTGYGIRILYSFMQLAQSYLFYIPVLISVHMTQEVNMKRLLAVFASVYRLVLFLKHFIIAYFVDLHYNI